MIEIPRAALTADEIAKEADFFSFGTNDLTQMTFGFSRDDAGKFLGAYYDKQDLRERSLRQAGSERRGQAGGDGLQAGPQTRTPTCIWASAASTAAIPPPWSSATAPVWTMCPALPSVCPSPVWPPLRLPSRRCNSPARASTNRITASLRSMTGGLFFPPWHVKLKEKQR